MKFSFKVAMALLLIIFGAESILAAVPCQEKTQPAMRCGPECPMMAKATDNNAIGKTETGTATPSCCKKSSQPSVPATAQRAPERPMNYLVQLSDCGDAVFPLMRSTNADVVQTRLRVNPQSQAVLCTFLI